MKKHKIFLAILIVSFLGLTALRTVVANRISTDGVALGRIQEETAYYKTENLKYKEKILAISSLGNISQKAKKLGFVDSKIGFVVGSSIPIAAVPNISN